AEEVDVVFELQLEHVVLVDAVLVFRDADSVAQQRQAGQGEIILAHGFVEEETEVCEDHPELLPTVARFELAQQVPAQLVL
ncbi:hypothetical protein EGW08_020217, partial [Elysia chlorotica]